MRSIAKWLGIVVVSLVAVAALAIGGLWIAGTSALGRHVTVADAPWRGDAAYASRERGAHLVRAVTGCMNCHRGNMGGGLFIDDPALGRVYASNLTSGNGGIAATYTDADFERAIRHGVRPDGTRLFIMPSWAAAGLSDSDLASISAFIRSQPPVDGT